MAGDPEPTLFAFQLNGWYDTTPVPWKSLPPLLLTMLMTRPYPIGDAASTPPVFTSVSWIASELRPVRLMLKSL